MTKYLSTGLGAAIIGAMGFSIWPVLWQTFGVMGGYMACLLVVAIMWYLNHHCGLMYNAPGAAWVDMAWGVAIAGITWGLIRQGNSAHLVHALPTLFCVALGGALGGIFAEKVKRNHPNFQHQSSASNSSKETADDSVSKHL